MHPDTAEHRRLVAAVSGAAPWRLWGPYLAEREWGTLREHYGQGADPWSSVPHDHARSVAYRWGEDGIAGWSDEEQHLCLSIALWNGNDPILKERLFGLAGPEGNHGEDVKEEYWYLDGTPTHSLMRMRYAYPHRYPYPELVTQGIGRSREDPEFEILDTGAFAESRYFEVDVTYAKTSETDTLVEIIATNRGPDRAACVVMPTVWFRNVWSWGYPAGPAGDVVDKPSLWRLEADTAAVALDHSVLGDYTLTIDQPCPVLFTDNDTNHARFGGDGSSGHAKDAFHRYLVHGEEGAVNPEQHGTKACFVVTLHLAPGASGRVRARLAPSHAPPGFADFDEMLTSRQVEADEFYQAIHHSSLDDTERRLQRRALAGMLWSKQLYHFDVAPWIDGDPAGPAPPPRHANLGWRHLNNRDVISMPDTWEYPWYAAWDLAFHVLPFGLVDLAFAKEQLRLITREWYMHPNGQLPAYEWEFGNVNPPVQAWAAWHLYTQEAARTGQTDRAFLEAMFHKLLINFTWWVNRKDSDNNNVFQGGFLGLDNISVFNRSDTLPGGAELDQSDGTAWMAFYTLEMLKIAVELATEEPVYQDLATKFFEHFLGIATAINGSASGPGLWDEQDGFFYDAIRFPDGTSLRLGIRSLVGLIPLLAAEAIDASKLTALGDFSRRMTWFLGNRPELTGAMARIDALGERDRVLFSVLSEERLARVLTRVLDETEFLSPHGIRSLSKVHQEHPFRLEGTSATVAYEPGESRSALYGGNSNWRGPVWVPLNVLIIEALREYGRYYGDRFTIAYPTGSGQELTLDEVADALADRLLSLFLPGNDGPAPSLRGRGGLVPDPSWHDEPLFHEYFHGDTGIGLGASHQTGWTGLVANLLDRRAQRRHG